MAWSESQQAAGDQCGLLHFIGSHVLWNSAGVRGENTLSREGEKAANRELVTESLALPKGMESLVLASFRKHPESHSSRPLAMP